MFLADGPDGALYVVDMYRAVIEHPEFMPPELKNRPDLTLGKDKGRIWRIVPEGHKACRPSGRALTRRRPRSWSHCWPTPSLAAHDGPAVAAGTPGPQP